MPRRNKYCEWIFSQAYDVGSKKRVCIMEALSVIDIGIRGVGGQGMCSLYHFGFSKILYLLFDYYFPCMGGLELYRPSCWVGYREGQFAASAFY